MQTFEEVNAHVEKNTAKLAKAAKKNDLKGIWPVVKPILILIAAFPLIPKTWRDAVTAFIPAVEAVLNAK